MSVEPRSPILLLGSLGVLAAAACGSSHGASTAGAGGGSGATSSGKVTLDVSETPTLVLVNAM